MNLILGVGLLLHPYILRLSSVLTMEGFNLYSQILTNGQFLRFGKDTFFLFMVPALLLFGKEKRALPRFEFLAMFFLVCISFINQNDFLMPSIFYQNIMVTAGIAILITLFKSSNKKTRNIFFLCLILNAFIFSAWIFLEKLGVKPYRVYVGLMENIKVQSTHGIGHITGPLNHPNLSGAYLALCLPAFLHYKQFKLIPIILTAIYFCDSALPVVTAMGVIFFYFYARFLNMGNLLPFLLVSGLGVLAYFTGINGLDNQRFKIWETALNNLEFNWLFGSGVGYFEDKFSLLYSKGDSMRQYKNLHSEFMTVLYAFGITGMGLIFMMLKRAVRASSPAVTAGLFGVFVNSYGNFPFHVSVLAFMAICYYVICLKESIEENHVKKMERKSFS